MWVKVNSNKDNKNETVGEVGMQNVYNMHQNILEVLNSCRKSL